MDTATKLLIETIGNTGFVVSITYDDDAMPVLTAVDERTREIFIVRHEGFHLAASELAGQVRIEFVLGEDNLSRRTLDMHQWPQNEQQAE